MILDFPTLRYKTIDVVNQDGYALRRTVITRRPWLRVIWMHSQKTILFGRHRISFTSEPDTNEHYQQASEAGEDWWEK